MITALLITTRDVLQRELNLKPEECMVQDDGRPPPSCGPRFLSIYGSSWSPDIVDQNLGIDERGALSVTMTKRWSGVAFDVRGQEIYLRECLDIETTLNQVKRHVHQNYTLINSANELLVGTEPIIEPLRWLGGDAQPQRVDNSWFSSEDPVEFAGLTMTINFGQARRMQTATNLR